jgi:hypothetical protein
MANAIQDPMDRLSTIIEGEKSPFVELSQRMKDTSNDIKNLNLSILDLAIALERRAGVTKEPKASDKNKETNNNTLRPIGEDLKTDFEDFKKGLIHGFTGAFVDFKDNISAKSEMPAQIEKPEQEKDIEKINEPSDDLQRKNEETNKITENNREQNKILSDMVAVLIDMRDDKSQKQLLDEMVSIRKVISEQNKKTELPGGIEPNTEEAKQEDREKLAEAIARKLAEEYDLPLRDCETKYKKIPLIYDFFDESVSYEFFDFLKNSSEEILEIMVHPALVDNSLLKQSSYGMARLKEYEILTSDRLKEFLEENKIELTNYREYLKLN